jgi:molybdenum cofactor biosynthesis protein MoaF
MSETHDWIPVGALGEAFRPGANLLPQSGNLSGKAVTLYLENGCVVEIRFPSARTLEWSTTGPSPSSGVAPGSRDISCSITEIRPRIYFVDFIDPEQRAATTSLVLDMTRRICTVVLGKLPIAEQVAKPMLERIAAGSDLTDVSATFLSGAIDTPFTPDTEKHAPTTELVGQRIEYTYSPTERYEHVYLNDRLYTWHCLEGSEKGLADTDRCHYLRLAPLLYLFVWREKLVPTLGVVLVDLEQLKTTGKIFGYRDFAQGTTVNFPVGARARRLGAA